MKSYADACRKSQEKKERGDGAREKVKKKKRIKKPEPDIPTLVEDSSDEENDPTKVHAPKLGKKAVSNPGSVAAATVIVREESVTEPAL